MSRYEGLVYATPRRTTTGDTWTPTSSTYPLPSRMVSFFYFRTGNVTDGLACFVYRKIHGELRLGYPGHLRGVRDRSRRRRVTADVRGVQVFEDTDPTRKRGRGDDGDCVRGCLARRRYVYFSFYMGNWTDVVFCSQEPRVAWRSD